MESVACDLCGKNDFAARYRAPDRLSGKSGLFQIVQCRNCGLAFVNPRPDAGQLARYYPAAYPSYQSAGGSAAWLKRILLWREVRMLSRILAADAKIIEVGSGSGEDLAYLRDRGGWEIRGTEISPDVVRIAQQRFGVGLYLGPLEVLGLPGEFYDLVRMKYVISHVRSPQRLLAEVSRILKTGGLVVIWLPNFNSWGRRIFGAYWEGMDPPTHLYELSPETIRRYLEESGFGDIRIRHSIVPNTWAHSFRNLLGNNKFLMPGLLSLLVFFPIAIAAAAARQSDRIIVCAKKK